MPEPDATQPNDEVPLADAIVALRLELVAARAEGAADVESALSTIKGILAIVNGLAVTNALLVLVTAGHYSYVTSLSDLSGWNIAFAVVLMVNIVRFYHGNGRHLDAAYGGHCITPAASGRHVELRGGLGTDFFVVFTQSLLFALTSFYIGSHSEFISLILVLLIFDIVWTVYSQQTTTAAEASPQRRWLLNNMFACIGLGVFFFVHRSHPAQAWTLDAALAVLAVTTVTDFALSWRFYFPPSCTPTEQATR